MPKKGSVPRYRLHKQSGKAIVTLPDGAGRRQDVLLGAHGTPESRLEYARVIAEWEANGRQTPQAKTEEGGLTVAELLARYWKWAEGYYRGEDGTPGKELENVKDALRPLKKLYAHEPAVKVGPLALRTLQQEMVASGLCRAVVNSRIGRIRRVFKWAVSLEIIPPSVHQALLTVPGLRRGKGRVREAPPVEPVRVEHVEAAQPHMPPPIRAMSQVQLLTACRAGEVMAMRAIDLNMSGNVWTYTPKKHKNKDRGLSRTIFIGPAAQEVIRPFLTTDLSAYLFSPRRWAEERQAARKEARKSKRTPSETKRQRKRTPKKPPGERYNRRSYRIAVVRACKKADVPPWSPLQLRHTAATIIRAKYGVEAAQVVLGHQRADVTQVYAERDLGKAAQIIAEIG